MGIETAQPAPCRLKTIRFLAFVGNYGRRLVMIRQRRGARHRRHMTDGRSAASALRRHARLSVNVAEMTRRPLRRNQSVAEVGIADDMAGTDNHGGYGGYGGYGPVGTNKAILRKRDLFAISKLQFRANPNCIRLAFGIITPATARRSGSVPAALPALAAPQGFLGHRTACGTALQRVIGATGGRRRSGWPDLTVNLCE